MISVVLQRPPHHARGRDRASVVGERRSARVCERTQLGELRAVLALRECCHEPDGHLRLRFGARTQAAERVGVVDHRVGVRNGQNRAVAAGRGGSGAGRNRFLVFASRCSEMDVGIDERRCQDQTARVDHPVLVRVQLLAELGDDAVVDPHVDRRVEPFGRVEQTGAADDDVLASGRTGEHQATPTADSTTTGPVVSRS